MSSNLVQNQDLIQWYKIFQWLFMWNNHWCF